MEIRQNYENSAKINWITVFIVIIVLQNVVYIYAKLSTDNSTAFTEALSNNLSPYHENPFNSHRNGNEVNAIDVWLTSDVNPNDESFNKFNGNRDDEQLSEGERAAHESKNGVTEMMAKEKGYLQSGNTSKIKQQLLTVLQQNKCNGNAKTTTTKTTTTTTTIKNKKQANTLSDKATTTPRTLTTMVTKKNAGMLTALSMRVNKNDFDKVDGRINATSRNHTEAAAAIKVKTATATATVKTKQPTSTTTTTAANLKRNSITSNNGSGITAKGVGSSVNTRLYYHTNGFLNPFGQLVAFFGSDQLHLQDYTFFFNAERHTVFHLHTSNNYYNGITDKSSSRFSTVWPTFAETVAAGSERILNVVTDPIGAVFAVNTPTTIKTKTKTSTTSSSAVSKKNTVSNRTGITSAFTTTTAYTAPPSLPPPATIKVEEVQLYNGQSLRQSRFNPFNPTRILVHGWFGGANAGVYQTLVPAYLRQYAGNYNVFTVDWGRGAVTDYLTASYRVKPVGKVLAKFIDFLQREAGIRYEDLHVIGFSMGAHIAGIAGKHVQTGRLPVIYALDPALPFFRYENFDERVAITDADYVEVVHTSVGSYGYDRPLGHVDFYVNYGSAQPGCFLNECSHFRAFQIFAESLQAKDGFQAEGCDVKLWPDLIKHRRCLMGTGRRMRLGGDPVNVTALRGRGGVFYLATNAVPPYARDVT